MKRKDPENIIQRAQKKEVEHMLEELLQELKISLDKSDILYSTRFRGQVNRILEWMSVHDYVDDESRVVSYNDDIGLLRRAFIHLAKSVKMLGGRSPYDVWRHLYLPFGGVDWHRSDSGDRALDNACYKAFSNMVGKFTSSSKMDMDSPLSFHVSSLLSVPGRFARTSQRMCFLEPNQFRDKYVLVCCINVPALIGSCGIQSLLNLCEELSLERGDVEMVIVARMHILADTEDDFYHLLSGFPDSCLAVPYEDPQIREQIWKKLGVGSLKLFQCFVYDKDGCFLKSFDADGMHNPYGAEAFPFTEEVVQKVHKERLALREDSLEKLLRPYRYSPDVVVFELNDCLPRRISEVIKNKHVWLYVCCDGSLIPNLHNLYEECKLEHEEEFEIVVLYLPLISKSDPRMFVNTIEGFMKEQKTRGWWCLPFNNSVSLRIWGLTMKYNCCLDDDEHEKDKLIIVGPDGKILDMYGAQIIGEADRIFPFTRVAVVENKMREVRELKLEESLFQGAQLFRGDDPIEDVISANTLLSSNKKIIIYMGNAVEHVDCIFGREYDFQGLVSQYKGMKKRLGDEFEVVFIEHPEYFSQGTFDAAVFGEMPWYIHCPCDGTYTDLAMELAESVSENEALIGFGEDALICSVKPLEGTPKLCLEDTLFDDLYQLFQYQNWSVI